ncbi:MAG: 5'-methylthioadenosine/S-adenosylhomocysteine nucleosidase [Clostridia bacterium]|nr:5'-methylthioadenosine/S-adenosylhomocysteine nucleosidase [Clostridia bacterium]
MSLILIQGAELTETEYLERKLENRASIKIGGFTFNTGKYENEDIVISRTKVGEINAAAATTIGILKFNPDIIINQGTAGGHSKDVHKGELVIGEKYIQINTFMCNYSDEGNGYNVNNWCLKEYQADEEKNLKESYKYATKELVKLAKNIIPKIFNKKVHSGVIASGDVWNREIDRILYLNKEYKTLCEEMETAGVYKIANSFEIPVITIRIVSNNEILKEEYEPQIAEKCQKLIYEFVKQLKNSNFLSI